MSHPAFLPDLPLTAMQWAQRMHDTHFHPDIAVKLPKAEQLWHVHGHFSKYTGKLAGLQRLQKGDAQLKILATDIFIMALSGANALPLDLGKWLGAHTGHPVTPSHFTSASLLRHMSVLNGQMGKALEAHDHIENFPVRLTLENALGGFCRTAIALSAQLGHDLAADTRARWQGIEARDPFIGYLLRPGNAESTP